MISLHILNCREMASDFCLSFCCYPLFWYVSSWLWVCQVLLDTSKSVFPIWESCLFNFRRQEKCVPDTRTAIISVPLIWSVGCVSVRFSCSIMQLCLPLTGVCLCVCLCGVPTNQSRSKSVLITYRVLLWVVRSLVCWFYLSAVCHSH